MRDPFLSRLYRKKRHGKETGPYYGWIYAGRARKCICTRCLDRAAAAAVLRERERQANSAAGVSPNTAAHTVTDSLRYMIEDRNTERSPATLEFYAKKAGHLMRLLGDEPMATLSLEQVDRYVNARIAEGASRSTIYRELITLRRTRKIDKKRGLLAGGIEDCIPEFKYTY